jgi:hypothetical protein
MNLAARHTSGNRLLKVDSDTFLEEDFLEAHPLNETGKAFWSGNWKTARNQNVSRWIVVCPIQSNGDRKIHFAVIEPDTRQLSSTVVTGLVFCKAGSGGFQTRRAGTSRRLKGDAT